jgi:hypothetical protein
MRAYKKSRKIAKSKRRVKRSRGTRKARRVRGGMGGGVTAFDVAALINGHWYVLRRTGAAGAVKPEEFPADAIMEVRELSDDRARHAKAQNDDWRNKLTRDNMAIIIFASRQALLSSSLAPQLAPVVAEAGTNFGPSGLSSRDKRMTAAVYVGNDPAAWPQIAPIPGHIYLIGYNQLSLPKIFQ